MYFEFQVNKRILVNASHLIELRTLLGWVLARKVLLNIGWVLSVFSIYFMNKQTNNLYNFSRVMF